MQTVGFSLAYFVVQLAVITHSKSATKKRQQPPLTIVFSPQALMIPV